MTANARTTFTNFAKYDNGVIYYGSMITAADVTDGTTNTVLVGEKYVNPDWYSTGQDPGDNEGAMIGGNADIERWSGLSATADLCRHCRTRRASTTGYCFGSRPQRQSQHGVLRRFGAAVVLYDRPRHVSLSVQPPG